MNIKQIEAELETFRPDELRHLALKAWDASIRKEGGTGYECSEDNPALLEALDRSLAESEARPGQGIAASTVEARLHQWLSK